MIAVATEALMKNPMQEEIQKEAEEDRLAIEKIRSRALRAMAVLEKSFIRRGSGRYFRLVPLEGD